MTALRMIVLALALALPLAGCVAYVPPGPPHRAAVWVPGHWGPFGHWVPGHWA